MGCSANNPEFQCQFPQQEVHIAVKMDVIKQVYEKVKSEYGKNITNKLKMVDALAVYAVVTGLVQVRTKAVHFNEDK